MIHHILPSIYHSLSLCLKFDQTVVCYLGGYPGFSKFPGISLEFPGISLEFPDISLEFPRDLLGFQGALILNSGICGLILP